MTETGILGAKVRAINVGLPSFADDLESQGVHVTRLDWKPPASGDEEMLDILERLGD